MKNSVFRLLTGGFFLIAALGCNTQSQPENEHTSSPEIQTSKKQNYEVVFMINDAYMGKLQL